MSKSVLRPTLLAALIVLTGNAHAGRLIDERTPPAPAAPAGAVAPVAAPAGAVAPVAAPAGAVAPVTPVAAPAGAASTVAAAPAELPVLTSGQTLSAALGAFLKQQNWALKWDLDYDYFVERNIPLTSNDIQVAITDLVSAYQKQGGFIGVAPRFSTANMVVLMEKVDHAR